MYFIEYKNKDIDSISGQIQEDIEIENEIKNFYKFMDPTKKHTLVLPPT